MRTLQTVLFKQALRFVSDDRPCNLPQCLHANSNRSTAKGGTCHVSVDGWAGLGVSNPYMLLEERQRLSVAPRVRSVKEVLFQIPTGVEEIVNRFQVRIRPSSGFNREDGILRAADDEERPRRNQGGDLPHLAPFQHVRNAVA